MKSLLTGFEEVYPLWALSFVTFGGLGWSTIEIGKVRARRRERKPTWCLPVVNEPDRASVELMVELCFSTCTASFDRYCVKVVVGNTREPRHCHLVAGVFATIRRQPTPLCMTQVLFMTGLIMAPLQLFVFPPLIKTLGAVWWMRIGCILGMFSFLATPNAKLFSVDDATLLAVSVASTTLVNCCLAAVRVCCPIMAFPESRQHAHERAQKAGNKYPEVW